MGGGSFFCVNRRVGGNGALSFTLHTEYYNRKYLSSGVCSWAFIFHLLVLLTLIVLPFVLTFSQGTFWLKSDIYTEQPKVEFKHQMYGEFSFTDPASKTTQVYTYSTQKTVMDRISVAGVDRILSPPVIKSSKQDFDRDGIAEGWNVTMRVKKPFDGAALTQATVLLGFDYETMGQIKMSMDTIAIINIADAFTTQTISAKTIKAVGTLDLKQESPLREVRGGRNLYNDNLFQYLEQETLDTFLSKRYFGSARRNETTIFNYDTFIQKGASAQTDFVDVIAVISIPKTQQILYAPGVWQVLKFAWIQYYSILVLVYFLLYHIFYSFVVKSKVFDSIEISQINLRALDYKSSTIGLTSAINKKCL